MLLSLDISTSCIGYAVFNEGNVLLELNYVKFNNKQSIFEKLDYFLEKINHITKFDIKSIAIEEPLKKFKGKYSSADVIATLNFFNGLVSGNVSRIFKTEPYYYNVLHARATAFPNMKVKKDGSSTKHQYWEKVVEKEPQINWIYGKRTRRLIVENYDMVDAYIVGLCHIMTEQKQKSK